MCLYMPGPEPMERVIHSSTNQARYCFSSDKMGAGQGTPHRQMEINNRYESFSIEGTRRISKGIGQ